jgi:hypothetical protein
MSSGRRVAHHRQLHLVQFVRRAFGCLGTSRSSSLATSPTPRVRVPRHIARLVVNYSALRRLIVDYFAYAARLGASAHRAACRRLLRLVQACRRLLHLCRTSGCLGTSRGSSRRLSSTTSPTRASGCFGTSRGSSCGSSSTTSPTLRVRVPRHVARHIAQPITRLIVDHFAYAARPGASGSCVARCATRRRLLRLRRASGCLGTSRGPSRGSSSTTLCAATSSCGHTGSTSTTPCITTTCLVATLDLLRVRHASPQHHLPVASSRLLISTCFPN